jgi:hypothetical protein
MYASLTLHLLPASVHCSVVNALTGAINLKTAVSWAVVGIRIVL